MAKAFGVLSLVAAVVSGLLGVLWAVFKAIGNEWDSCRSGECTNGYVVTGVFIGLAAICALVGVTLLRGGRNRSGSDGRL